MKTTVISEGYHFTKDTLYEKDVDLNTINNNLKEYCLYKCRYLMYVALDLAIRFSNLRTCNAKYARKYLWLFND